MVEYKDYVAKLTNNVVRVAAVFHVFKCDEGPISVATYLQAERLGCWFLDEYISLFPRETTVSPLENDANVLMSWLSIKLQGGPVKVSVILQRGPCALRSKARRDAALALLVQRGDVVVSYVGKTQFVYPPPYSPF